jgi:hypothetical protein
MFRLLLSHRQAVQDCTRRKCIIMYVVFQTQLTVLSHLIYPQAISITSFAETSIRYEDFSLVFWY